MRGQYRTGDNDNRPICECRCPCHGRRMSGGGGDSSYFSNGMNWAQGEVRDTVPLPKPRARLQVPEGSEKNPGRPPPATECFSKSLLHVKNMVKNMTNRWEADTTEPPEYQPYRPCAMGRSSVGDAQNTCSQCVSSHKWNTELDNKDKGKFENFRKQEMQYNLEPLRFNTKVEPNTNKTDITSINEAKAESYDYDRYNDKGENNVKEEEVSNSEDESEPEYKTSNLLKQTKPIMKSVEVQTSSESEAEPKEESEGLHRKNLELSLHPTNPFLPDLKLKQSQTTQTQINPSNKSDHKLEQHEGIRGQKEKMVDEPSSKPVPANIDKPMSLPQLGKNVEAGLNDSKTKYVMDSRGRICRGEQKPSSSGYQLEKKTHSSQKTSRELQPQLDPHDANAKGFKADKIIKPDEREDSPQPTSPNKKQAMLDSIIENSEAMESLEFVEGAGKGKLDEEPNPEGEELSGTSRLADAAIQTEDNVSQTPPNSNANTIAKLTDNSQKKEASVYHKGRKNSSSSSEQAHKFEKSAKIPPSSRNAPNSSNESKFVCGYASEINSAGPEKNKYERRSDFIGAHGDNIQVDEETSQTKSYMQENRDGSSPNESTYMAWISVPNSKKKAQNYVLGDGSCGKRGSIALEMGSPPIRTSIPVNDGTTVLIHLSEQYDNLVLSPSNVKLATIARSTSLANVAAKNIRHMRRKQEILITAGSSRKSKNLEDRDSMSMGQIMMEMQCNTKQYHVCHSCHKIVEKGEGSFHVVGGSYTAWHRHCFKCQECNKTLTETDYKFFDEEPYCMEHFLNAANVPKCAKCQNIILDPSYTLAGGNSWHKDHFKCYNCKVTLADTRFVLREQKYPYCFSCHEQNFSKHCKACRKKILLQDPYIQNGDFFWHSSESCLFCATCNGSLVGRSLLFQRAGQLYCNRYCAVRET